MLDVLDALVDLVKQADTSLVYDDSAAAPYEWRDGTVYSWIETTNDRSIGTGEVRQDFEIMIVYASDNDGEEARLTRSRAVSEALDSWRRDVMDLIRQNTHVPPWSSGTIAARSDEDFLRQLEVRGVAIMVGGYRIRD